MKRKETRFKLLFEGFKPLATVLLAYAIITGLTVVGLILLIVPGIAVVLDFSMTYYIIAEDPGISFQAALEQIWKLTDGYKMELLELNLRFIPWYLFGLLYFLVGMFVLVPWHSATLTLNYQYLKENAKLF